MDIGERFRLISCAVFTREVCGIVATSRHIVDPEFLELAAHEDSERLRSLVQDAVDRAEGKGYSAVLLAYGLCGNGLAGIRARSIPLVLPRAHDCCTLLLGSSSAFVAEFGESLSAPWSSVGYLERSADYMRRSDDGKANGFGLEYAELVEKYGEDNAEYLWTTLHPEVEEQVQRFIDLDETAQLGRAGLVRKAAESEGRSFRLIRGDSMLLRALVEGPWSDDRFLVVPPGASVVALYDFERVVDLAEEDGMLKS